MARIRATINSIHAWRHHDEIAREVETELRLHIGMRTRGNIEARMTRHQAQRAALLILNAGLAASFTRTDAQTQSGNSSANQASAQRFDDRLLSPRLAALRDRIKSGDREALDNFWKEISERGAPMIEPAADNDREM